MTDQLTGQDALNALTQEDGGGNGVEFSSLKSGTSYTVKVLGTADLFSFYSYGIFKQVNSFVAETPSKKSAKGYPVENHTPWDLAWQYYKDKAQEAGEDYTGPNNAEAGKYRPKQRFAFGFYDLDSAEPIIVDLSKKQGQAIHAAIKKYENKLGKTAFELSKQGSGTNTSVSLTPIIDMDEDLTDEQRKNFAEAPAEFDHALFDGLLYEADNDEQVELLTQAGFDVELLGFSKKNSEQAEAISDDEGDEDVEF